MRLFLILLVVVIIMLMCLFLTSCGVTAKSYVIEERGIKKQVLEIDRGARAKFPDGGEIEGDLILKVPEFPPIKLEQ